MVGLDGQFQDLPALLGAFGLDELAAVPGDVAGENQLAPLSWKGFGASDEMVDEQVYSMLVALVFHEGFHSTFAARKARLFRG